MADLLRVLSETLPGGLANLIIAGVSFLSGVAVAVVTPLARWAVEQKRRRDNRRRELIQSVREIVENESSLKLPGFTKTAIYSAIRPDLKPEVIHRLESDEIEVVLEGVGRAPTDKNLVLDEMARLERKWKLI